MTDAELPNVENPFSTRRTRPGATPFLFASGQDAETLVQRLRQSGWRGEIVGPHGSGKSALLAALIPTLELAGRHVVLVQLHDGQRRLPADFLHAVAETPATLPIVDGYEQLSRWRRWRLGRLCRRRGWGLLVTAHASVGLPQLCRTAATPELAAQVVGQLLAQRDWPFAAAELDECFARRNGNLREVLFDLYDLCERRRSRA
jgi:hypothetical protein